MEIHIEKLKKTGKYFLYLSDIYNFTYVVDILISKKLSLNLDDYQKILKKFNAFKYDDGDYYLKTLEEANNAKQYLNDNYMIILKLRGE